MEPKHTDIENEMKNYFEFNMDCGVSPPLVCDVVMTVQWDKITHWIYILLERKKQWYKELLHKIEILKQQYNGLVTKEYINNY